MLKPELQDKFIREILFTTCIVIDPLKIVIGKRFLSFYQEDFYLKISQIKSLNKYKIQESLNIKFFHLVEIQNMKLEVY